MILDQQIPARGELALLRKQLIVLRRYMAPQRCILPTLYRKITLDERPVIALAWLKYQNVSRVD